MAGQRRGGIISFNIDGILYDAKGEFTYNLGRPKREGILGVDGVHGYKEMPQLAFVEGEITDRGNLDLDALVSTTDATVTLQLANDKVIALRHAWYAGEGSGKTNEGNIAVRFESDAAEEIPNG